MLLDVDVPEQAFFELAGVSPRFLKAAFFRQHSGVFKNGVEAIVIPGQVLGDRAR